MTPSGFQTVQAVQLSRAFDEEGVDYLFIGKGAAILLGFTMVTQDIDVFAERNPENGRRIVRALRKLGFDFPPETDREIVAGKDFVQIHNGPFDLDIIFAPDGISSFSDARSRALMWTAFGLPICATSLRANARVAGRKI